MLITIIIAIVFFFLLAQAIIETICGICMIIYALIMMLIVAPLLDLMACVVRIFSKPKPKAAKRGTGTAIALHFGSIK